MDRSIHLPMHCLCINEETLFQFNKAMQKNIFDFEVNCESSTSPCFLMVSSPHIHEASNHIFYLLRGFDDSTKFLKVWWIAVQFAKVSLIYSPNGFQNTGIENSFFINILVSVADFFYTWQCYLQYQVATLDLFILQCLTPREKVSLILLTNQPDLFLILIFFRNRQLKFLLLCLPGQCMVYNGWRLCSRRKRVKGALKLKPFG